MNNKDIFVLDDSELKDVYVIKNNKSAIQTILTKAGFDPNQPRSEDGTWGSGGGENGFDVTSYGYELEKQIDGLKTLFLFEQDGVLDVNTIIIDREKRGKGIGSLVMQKIIKLADKNKWLTELVPAVQDDFQGTTSKSRLVEFYKRFGFVENKGRNKDFTRRSGGMYRTPR